MIRLPLTGLMLLAAVHLGACGSAPLPSSGSAPDAAALGTDTEAALTVYSWPDYIAPDTVKRFEAETGIKVNYQTFDNDQDLERKLLIGNADSDVVVPTGPYFARLLKAAAYRKLDKAQLPNLKNLDPAILKRLAGYDPGNQYAVPYLWNTTGIAYNVEKVRERLGAKPPDSWAILFDPANAAKLKDCGIALVESPIEVVASAILYLGKDPHRLAPEDLAAAAALLKGIRPYVRYTSPTQTVDDLANGAICLSLSWSGDAVTANDRAQKAGKGVRINYLIPKEGALISVDMMSILARAAHPHNAVRWLDFLMRPEVMAGISNYTKYPSGNLAAIALVDPEVKSNPAIYPDATTAARLSDAVAATPEYSLQVNREWARFRANYQ